MSPPAVNCPPAPVRTTKRTRVVAVELGEEARQLVAREHRDPVELPGHVQRDRRHAAVAVVLDPESVVLAHTLSFGSSRRTLRRIFPDALFGSDATSRYSRGRLNRASGEARQCASSSSAVASPTTTATTRCTEAVVAARRSPPPRARPGGSRGRPRPRPGGCSRRRRRSCRRAGRRPRGRRRRRDDRCRRCGTSRRESPSRRRRAGSSSRRTPRRPRGGRRSRRSARACSRVLTEGRPAQPGFAAWSRPIEKV